MLFLQGAARPKGLAGACFALFEIGLVRLCLSAEIFEEIQDVLSRPALRHKFRSLTDDLVERFLDSARSRAIWIPSVAPRFEFARDPEGRPVYQPGDRGGSEFPRQPR
jgi:predicted nucleic acid-binding protein